MTLHLEIVTPERLAYEDDVDMVLVPGAEGELGSCRTTRRSSACSGSAS